MTIIVIYLFIFFKLFLGTAVVVLHNILWRRGLIVDGGRSVLLVDLGVLVKLNKKK